MTVGTSMRAPAPGTVLVGKYRVERVLGVGGMGMVVAAHHLQLDERVALKFLLAETALNEDGVKRFIREARAAVKIKSDHVARVSDVGTLEDGTPYLVMEYLEGADLASELERRGRFAVEDAVELVLQACEAIAEAHALGIVHRDLKPANLFLTRRPGGVPWIKVLDFGISKVSGGADIAMTRTSAVLGSPLYMSPEQIRASREVDARADLWALGVILYELVCGGRPFTAEALPELSVKVAIEPPNAFPADAQVPPALQSAILRCLEKERDRRFASVATFAQALVPFASRRASASIERIANALGTSSAELSASALGPGPASAEPPRSFAAARSADHGPLERGPATGGGFAGTGNRHDGGRKSGTGARIALGVLAVGAVAAAGALFLHRSSAPSAGVSADVPPSAAPVVTPVSAAPSKAPEPPEVEVTPAPSASAAEPVAAKPSVLPAVEAASASPSTPPGPARTGPRVRGGTPSSKGARPTPAPATKPEPLSAPPSPAPASKPAPVDVFNNRKFD
ncbi:MAG TPA: protein kinase [Polyangiaceae bacterium]|nr:protein kinase [Polyangiaceae bacterium]